MNLFGIKQYLIALFPGDNRTGISNGAACGIFNRSGVTGSINFCGNVWRIFADQTKTHQSLFVYEHEDDSDDDDPHHGKPSAHSSLWHAIWLIVHLIAVITRAEAEHAVAWLGPVDSRRKVPLTGSSAR